MQTLIDKNKLTEHLETCIEISEKKEPKVAAVLINLKKEVEEGAFDQED